MSILDVGARVDVPDGHIPCHQRMLRGYGTLVVPKSLARVALALEAA
jgi:hypothetical protein